jgi:hypothetical protein
VLCRRGCNARLWVPHPTVLLNRCIQGGWVPALSVSSLVLLSRMIARATMVRGRPRCFLNDCDMMLTICAVVEREMKICHNQPHLIPPMKLVLYGDGLPATRQRSSSHLSQWVTEGRNKASRASSRASVSIKKRASRKPQIGNPSDFRRVDPPRARVEPFRPLELSIYLPGNRLSPLRGFDDIDVDELGRLQFPERALLRSRSETLLSQSSGAYQIPRKPVASMVSENDLSWSRSHTRQNTFDANDRYTQSRPSFCETINSQDMPSTAEGPVVTRARSSSEPPQTTNDLRAKATLTEPFQDAFSPILEETVEDTPNLEPTTPSTLNLPLQAPPTPPSPPPPASSATSSPTRKRVTQWLLRSPSISYPSNPQSQFYLCSPKSGPTTHTRTLSASTMSSMVSASAPTISSFSTQHFSQFSPSRVAAGEKEQEHGLAIKEHGALPPMPPSYEDSCQVADEEANDKDGAVRISAAGLAF